MAVSMAMSNEAGMRVEIMAELNALRQAVAELRRRVGGLKASPDADEISYRELVQSASRAPEPRLPDSRLPGLAGPPVPGSLPMSCDPASSHLSHTCTVIAPLSQSNV